MRKMTPDFPRLRFLLRIARGGTRTRTTENGHRILSPERLPFRHPGENVPLSLEITGFQPHRRYFPMIDKIWPLMRYNISLKGLSG